MRNWYKRPYLRWVILALLTIGCYQLLLERRMYPTKSGIALSGLSNSSYENYDQRKRIRVSTFNIHKVSGDKHGSDVDISDIAKALSTDDLAGLQEVLGESFWGSANQAEQIAKLSRVGWLFAPAQTRFNRVYTGNALLSKISTSNWQVTPLIWSHTEDRNGDKDKDKDKEITSGKHRNLIKGHFQLGGKEVVVFVTHIDRREIRPIQLQAVFDEFGSHEYAILLGDLNTHPNEKIMLDWFASKNSTDMIGLSNSEHDNQNRVDWILTQGFKFIDGGSQDNKLSDHPYYWAEIEIVD